MSKLILASQSPYRKILLERLGIPFEVQAPDCDESRFDSLELSVPELTARLAETKARSVAPGRAGNEAHCIIGCDQLVEWNGKALGKPGTRASAIAQLEQLSQGIHFLHTSTCLLFGGTAEAWTDTVSIRLHSMSRQAIEAYVDRDKPWDCAGSYRFEKHGIALIESLEASDPTAIEGLPLIELHRRLRRLGWRSFEL